MTTTRSRTTNPLINIILVFSVGLSALEISQLVFDPTNRSSLLSLEFNSVFESMFQSMFLSAENLVSFMAVLVAWLLSGMVAGVRAKSGFWGALAGFLGTLLGTGFLAFLNLDVLSDSTTITEFGLGTAACIIIACVAAYATGSATKEKPTLPKTVKTRKVWVASKSKEVWTCSKCGKTIPPGAFTCPTCGEPVIE
ncbi:MAG: hypothetical protein ACFE9L_04155 [Candidatus Hodarchaeota archaeon]